MAAGIGATAACVGTVVCGGAVAAFLVEAGVGVLVGAGVNHVMRGAFGD